MKVFSKYCLIKYDPQEWPFAEILKRDVFKVPRLENLHDFILAKKKRLGYKIRLSNEDNLAMRQLMRNQKDDSPFYQLYRHFMVKILAPLVGQSLTYSSHPEMRVHLAGTASASAFHNDVSVTNRVDQINFWMPFTDVYDTATLWVESDYGLADYQPIPVKYGQVLIFDGGYLDHGTKTNTTNTTRISIDMRFSVKQASTREEGLRLLHRMIKLSQN